MIDLLHTYPCHEFNELFRLGAERLMGSSEELQSSVFTDASKLLTDGSLDVRFKDFFSSIGYIIQPDFFSIPSLCWTSISPYFDPPAKSYVR